jgi:hypothetical protein
MLSWLSRLFPSETARAKTQGDIDKLSALAESSSRDWTQALEALLEFKPDTAHWVIKRRVTKGLTNHLSAFLRNHPDTIYVLGELLDDSSHCNRDNSTHAHESAHRAAQLLRELSDMGNLPATFVIPGLAKGLWHQPTYIVQVCAEALASNKHPDALAALIDNSRLDFRANIIVRQILASIDDPDAKRALAQYAAGEHRPVQTFFCQACGQPANRRYRRYFLCTSKCQEEFGQLLFHIHEPDILSDTSSSGGAPNILIVDEKLREQEWQARLRALSQYCKRCGTETSLDAIQCFRCAEPLERPRPKSLRPDDMKRLKEMYADVQRFREGMK